MCFEQNERHEAVPAIPTGARRFRLASGGKSAEALDEAGDAPE